MKQIFSKHLVKKTLAILLIFFLIQYLTYLCIINNNKEIQEPFRMNINFDVLNENMNNIKSGISQDEEVGKGGMMIEEEISEEDEKMNNFLISEGEEEEYNNYLTGNNNYNNDNLNMDNDMTDDELDQKCKNQYGDGENGKKYSQFVRISHETEPDSNGACNRYFNSISDFNIEDDEGFSDNTTKDFYKPYSKGGGLCCTISKDKITDLCKKKYNKFDKHAAVKVEFKAGSCSSKGYPDALDFKSPLEDWSCCAS